MTLGRVTLWCIITGAEQGDMNRSSNETVRECIAKPYHCTGLTWTPRADFKMRETLMDIA